jgi:hypothetical protein
VAESRGRHCSGQCSSAWSSACPPYWYYRTALREIRRWRSLRQLRGIYPTTIFPTKYAGKREHFSPFRSNVDIHSPVTSLEGRLFGEKQTQSGTTTEHLGQTKKDFISPTNGDRIEHLSTIPRRFETSVMARFVRTGVAVGCGAHAACCARSGRKKNGTRCACHRDCVQSEITLARPRDNFMCPSALDDPHPRW